MTFDGNRPEGWWKKFKKWVQPLPPLRELESDTDTRSIVESAYDAFIAMDEFGRIVDWNLQAQKTFGWSKAEVRGKILSEVVIPERHREAHTQGLKRYLKTGVGPMLNQRIEVLALHRSQSEIPVELTIYPIQQKSGILFGAFLHDITEQKQAQKIQSLQLETAAIFLESESLEIALPALLRCICENFDLQRGEAWAQEDDKDELRQIASWSAHHTDQKEFSEKSRRLAFKKGEGLAGQVWESQKPIILEDLSQESNLAEHPAALATGFRSAIAVPSRAVEGKTLGALVFYSSKAISLDQTALNLLADIGLRTGLFMHRKRTEENLNRLRADLELKVEERTRDLARAYEQAQVINRLKDEFLATLSHELRTPLGVIQGYVDMLLEGGLSEEEVQNSLMTIHRNTRIQTQIITDLLDVSSIITGKMRLEMGNINLDSLLMASLETVKMAAAAKKIQLTTDFSPDVRTVRGDSRRLQQVFWNLLSNAVKFTPSGGKVRLALREENSKVFVEVSDTGKGVDPAFIPHIYERFRQEDASTTRRFGGLGLGLAIVRHIVEAHGGNVEARSEGIGKGAQFIVSFPALESAAGASYSSVTDATSTSLEYLSRDQVLKGEQILIVDDEMDTRKMLSLILERAGAQVYTARDFEEALEMYEMFHPHFIVSDISMPGHDGYELIKALKKLSAECNRPLHAVALTAHASTQDRDKVLTAGFEMHLTKPIHPEDLVKQMAGLIRSTKAKNLE